MNTQDQALVTAQLKIVSDFFLADEMRPAVIPAAPVRVHPEHYCPDNRRAAYAQRNQSDQLALYALIALSGAAG